MYILGQLTRLTAEFPLKGLVSRRKFPLFQGFQVDEWVEIVEVSSVFQELPREDVVIDIACEICDSGQC